MRRAWLSASAAALLACGPGSPDEGLADEVEGSASDGGGSEGESDGGELDGSDSAEQESDDRRLPPDLDPVETIHCDFADPYIEQLVAEAAGLESGPVPVELAAQILELTNFASLPGDFPTDLAGIECVEQLVRLHLPAGTLDELGPLASLGALTHLHISNNLIAELGPLLDLELVRLSLERNLVAELGPLAGMTSLRTLILYEDPIPEGELAELIGIPLAWLDIGYTGVTSLDDVLLFDELEVLAIDGLPIDSIAPLQGSTIIDLSMRETEVVDLSPLLSWGPQGIGCVDVRGVPVTDIGMMLDVDWTFEYTICGSCPRFLVDEETLDDFGKNVVLPQLCDMGVNVNGCLFCPQ